MSAIPRALFEEWKVFDELDPDVNYRLDWGLSHVVQSIMRDGKPLRDFMLEIGDYRREASLVAQTVEYQEMLLDAWISGSNAIFKEKEARTK